jgi:hypothetical protein
MQSSCHGSRQTLAVRLGVDKLGVDRLGIRGGQRDDRRRSASSISRSMLVLNQAGLLKLSAEHDHGLGLVSTIGNSVAQSSEHSDMEVGGDPNPAARRRSQPVNCGRAVLSRPTLM